jgi:hypothetical protein
MALQVAFILSALLLLFGASELAAQTRKGWRRGST